MTTPTNLYGFDVNKVLYGENAISIPFWAVLQKSEDNVTSFIGATRTKMSDFWGIDFIHKLVVGDLVMRPHVAVGSNACTGVGLGSFLIDPWQGDTWLEGTPLVGTDAVIRDILKYAR